MQSRSLPECQLRPSLLPPPLFGLLATNLRAFALSCTCSPVRGQVSSKLLNHPGWTGASVLCLSLPEGRDCRRVPASCPATWRLSLKHHLWPPGEDGPQQGPAPGPSTAPGKMWAGGRSWCQVQGGQLTGGSLTLSLLLPSADSPPEGAPALRLGPRPCPGPRAGLRCHHLCVLLGQRQLPPALVRIRLLPVPAARSLVPKQGGSSPLCPPKPASLHLPSLLSFDPLPSHLGYADPPSSTSGSYLETFCESGTGRLFSRQMHIGPGHSARQSRTCAGIQPLLIPLLKLGSPGAVHNLNLHPWQP